MIGSKSLMTGERRDFSSNNFFLSDGVNFSAVIKPYKYLHSNLSCNQRALSL